MPSTTTNPRGRSSCPCNGRCCGAQPNSPCSCGCRGANHNPQGDRPPFPELPSDEYGGDRRLRGLAQQLEAMRERALDRRLSEPQHRRALRAYDRAVGRYQRLRMARRGFGKYGQRLNPAPRRRRRRNPSGHEWLDILIPLGLLWLVVRGQGIQLGSSS